MGRTRGNALNRALDSALAGLVLAAASPVLALAAVAVKLQDGGPVLYRQTRVGKDGEDFELLKLRTMVVGAETQGAGYAVSEGDSRITRVGRLLRRASVDELPQLWNVVRGEMSLIGPRPLILDEARHVDDWGRRRLDLKPGMTGVWQVLGRSQIAFEEMVKLDYLYVTTWSLGHDLRLLLETVPLVLRGEAPV